MVWLKKISAYILILLVLLFSTEHAVADQFIETTTQTGQENTPPELNVYIGYFGDLIKSGSDFSQKVPVPNTRTVPVHWQHINVETDILPCPPFKTYPEFLQDIWRCPTVAFVLFPFHEFL